MKLSLRMRLFRILNWHGRKFKGHYQFFNFGRNNRLSFAPIVSDEDYHKIVYWWLSGRIFGKYVSWTTEKLQKFLRLS